MAFENERVMSISAGFKHVVCKTGLGKIFVWGNNSCGQLGLNHFENQTFPVQLMIEDILPPSSKPLQIKASFSSTILLTEPDKLYWWGKNSRIKNASSPIEINLAEILKITSKEQFENLIPIKIISKFSQSVSLVAIALGNTIKIPEPKYVKLKICNTLSSKWDYDSVHPPVIESVTKHFSFSQLDKSLLTNPKNAVKEKDEKQETLTQDESEILFKFYDLFFSENKPKAEIASPKLKMRMVSPKKFGKNTLDQLSEKVFRMKERVFVLMNTERNEWSKSDELYMKNVSDQKLQLILKKF